MSIPAPQINFTIDGKTLTAPKGTTVYNAAKSAGIDIPIFCYHEKMPPFGACRMCLVEVEKMPKLQASCTLEVSEGMSIKTASDNALNGRKGILEFLLLNHPLDCPICDKGGECPLQDNAINHGPGESRFYEEKRHFKKHLPLGPVLMLDRERCIACARCTRFSDIISGDHALELVDRGFKTEVGTPNGGPAESKFIGNTIQICPVGALTSQVYRFKARPWDNKATKTTCTLCPVGCSMNLDSRDGDLMRTRSEPNAAVNDVWLCDKGFFGYEYISAKERLKTPLIRKEGKLVEVSWDEALRFASTRLGAAKGKKVAALGGNPLSIEAGYMLQKLVRQGLDSPHVDSRIGHKALSLDEEGIFPHMETPIADIERLDTIILAGLDITEEFPVLWLRVKAAINRGADVRFIGHFAPEVAHHLKKVLVHTPGRELETLTEVTAGLDASKKAAIFFGSQYLTSPLRQGILAAAKLKKVPINVLEGSGNSMGARFAGMHPELEPGYVTANRKGLSWSEVLSQPSWDALIVAGSDVAAKVSVSTWKKFREHCGFVMVCDLFLSQTAQAADVVFPVLSAFERTGSFMNLEGRISQTQPGCEPLEGALCDSEVFQRLGTLLGTGHTLAIDESFRKLMQPIVDMPRGQLGQKTPHLDIAKEGECYVIHAPRLFDEGVRMQHNLRVKSLKGEDCVRIHPQEGVAHGLKNGDIALIVSGAESCTLPVRFEAGVARRTLVLPENFWQIAKTAQISKHADGRNETHKACGCHHTCEERAHKKSALMPLSAYNGSDR